MTQGDQTEIAVSLRDLVTFLVRGLLPSLFLALVAGGATYTLRSREAPVFRAEATLIIVRSSSGFSQLGLSPVTAPPLDLSAYRAAVVSDPVLVEALGTLGVASPSDDDIRRFRGRIGTSVDTGVRDSSLLRVEALSVDPDGAIAASNAAGDALVAWDRRRASDSMARVIETLEKQIAALTEQVRTLQVVSTSEAQTQIDGLVRLRAEQQQELAYARALIASAEGLATMLQRADTTVRQIAPNPLRDGLIAAMLAIAATYLTLLVSAAFNKRLRGVDDIAHAAMAPVVGEFPKARDTGDARVREAASYLRAKLLFATSDAHPKVFLITSAVANEGKTTVSTHLAESFVRYGYRTLLVDADLRSPSIHEHYTLVGSMREVTPLRAWLAEPGGHHTVLRVNVEGGGTLDVVPQFTRSSDGAEAQGRGLAALLDRWSEYDVIVIDTAPVLAVADPLLIAPSCTATVVVVDPQRSDRPDVETTAQMLRGVGARVVGVVVNRLATVRRTAGYGYGSRSGGGTKRSSRKSRKEREIGTPAPYRRST